MPLPNSDEAARQLRQHVERLLSAGVEFAPAPDPSLPAPRPAASLFDAAPEPQAPASDCRVELAVLAEEVKACTACKELASTRTQTVFGVGPIGAEICFIGEAPGADEDRQGEPFVGPAGQLLNKIIVACGMKREEVYICNILRCRPPGNRTPRSEEAANCRGFLDRTLDIIGPKYIVCLGAVAANNLLDTKMSIGKMRGRFWDYHGIPVVCTYHPSYLLRSQADGNLTPKRQVWEDMQMLLKRMDRPIPEGKKT